jgi:hypothetical protein
MYAIASVAAAVGACWWRVRRVRRAFARGIDVMGRVTHFVRLADDPRWAATGRSSPSEALGAFVRAPRGILNDNLLIVAYSAEGLARTAQYSLDHADVERLGPAVGAEVALIVDSNFPKPLLRDVYLGRPCSAKAGSSEP